MHSGIKSEFVMSRKQVLTILFILSINLFSGPVLAQENSDYTYYYNLGYAKLVDGSFDESIEIFHQTLKLKPDCTEAQLALGIAYRQLGELEKALEYTQLAIKTDPSYYKAYYNLALIWEQKGNKKEAFEAYKTFYKKVPEAKNIPNLKAKISRLKREL